MNYQRIYDQIIDRAKERKLEGYKEKHHIIPKCMGGGNEKRNLAELTAREHYLTHWILCRIYPEDGKLAFAFWAMSNQKGGKCSRNYIVGSRAYEEAREHFIHNTDWTERSIKRVANIDWKLKVSNTDYGSFQAKRIASTDYTKRQNNQEYSAKRSKAVIQCNKQGILLNEWQSVKVAGETLDIARSNISSCLTGKLESAGGFIWKYKN